MKVLMIEHFSSSNNYSVDLCRMLDKYVDLKLLTVNNSNLKVEKFKFNKKLYGEYRVNIIKKIFLYIKSIIYIVYEIVKGKYDVIHIQSFRSLLFEPLLYLILLPFTKKIVITVHNISPHEGTQKNKRILQLLYSKVDSLIVHNNQSKKVLSEKYKINPENIFVIPHGSYFVKNEYIDNTQNKKFNFLFFGLIRKYKGIDVLINAISSLPNNIKENIFVNIVGKQDNSLDNTDYKKLILDKNLGNIIHFVPERIPDDELSNYFNNADFCVFPYRNIYGSGALLMSYSFNVPVIVSNLPSFIEETNNGGTGLIFKSEDIEDLSRVLCNATILNKNELSIYKENIKILVNNKYNWDISAKSTVECYSYNKNK
ncbi:glycosyltransferase family 4 protein [Clostridium sp.]|uniref:glycosyltransferase family 4 protein n=1 Tax=Clostridium sp. TaxID=1506 RepID=UPI002909BED1|nr:glycosyltransferase family 4 protein [Clostridium sp.]MDU3526246.1 glycosyltransferase family 4 protein [Clostridium sp.]MDU3548475.1 glycosyltransferase family 4 protein [Clostridium sp.]